MNRKSKEIQRNRRAKSLFGFVIPRARCRVRAPVNSFYRVSAIPQSIYPPLSLRRREARAS